MSIASFYASPSGSRMPKIFCHNKCTRRKIKRNKQTMKMRNIPYMNCCVPCGNIPIWPLFQLPGNEKFHSMMMRHGNISNWICRRNQRVADWFSTCVCVCVSTSIILANCGGRILALDHNHPYSFIRHRYESLYWNVLCAFACSRGAILPPAKPCAIKLIAYRHITYTYTIYIEDLRFVCINIIGSYINRFSF